jgi:ATP/maltotriose-dependent transcriptional regulator MalT
MLRELGGGLAASSTSTELAQIELRGGDLARAEEALRRDYEELSAIGERYILAGVVGLRAKVAAAMDDWERADQLSAELRELAGADDVAAQVDWRGLQAVALARRGDLEAAVALAAEAIELARETEFPILQAEALLRRAEVERAAGSATTWRTWITEAIARYDAKGDVASRARAEALLASADADDDARA